MFRRLYSSTAKKSKDPFDILSLSKNASATEIKKRYYELAKTLHPDTPTGDIEQFQQVAKAYEFLSDPIRRNNYLRTGIGWDLPTGMNDPWGVGNRPPSYTNAYWAAKDDISYKAGPWSSHENPRFMKNGTFFTIVAALSVTIGIVHFINIISSHSNFINAADRHHLRTSEDLRKARTEAQLFGNQRAVERMIDHRMKHFREKDDSIKKAG
ncbi:DnaJ domain-containing protein [Fennellomyces sp. T-0311]|nr:DnaJ domain-containing protein [Fennellomyces sp. T-0311]